jgi:hypothetical protein
MNASRWFSLMIVSSGIALSLFKFVGVDGLSRHIDTAWLYSASACLLDGLSPYNLAQFTDCWVEALGRDFIAPFVFGPPILALLWPLALFEERFANMLVDAANVGAILWLAVILWKVSEQENTDRLRQAARPVWLAFGLSVGGVAGAAYTGQPVVLVSLGLALVYLGLRDRGPVIFTVGTLLCLVKPHLILLPLAALWMSRPGRLLVGKAFAIAAVAICIGAVAFLEGNFFTDYSESLRAHSNSDAAMLTDLTVLYGVPGVFASYGTVAGAALSLGIVTLALAFGASSISRSAILGLNVNAMDTLLVGALFTGLAIVPAKEYDFAVTALGFAVISRMPLKLQLICIVPMLLVWRPRIAIILGASPEQGITLVTMVLLAIGAGMIGLAIGSQFARSK